MSLKSNAVALGLGAIALLTSTVAQAAANPPFTQTVDLRRQAIYPVCVPEQDQGTGGSETPALFNLTAAGAPVPVAAAGYAILVEEPQGSPVSSLCISDNINSQLNSVLGTGNELPTGTFPGYMATGFPMIDIGCSDVIVLTNNAINPNLGEIILINDFSSTADVQNLGVIGALATPAAGPAGLPSVGSINEPGPPDAGAITANLSLAYLSGGRAIPVSVSLSDTADGTAAQKCGNATLLVSDQINVAVPALPPWALLGLMGVLGGSGIVLVRRRRTIDGAAF
jgi:hypothetical protein